MSNPRITIRENDDKSRTLLLRLHIDALLSVGLQTEADNDMAKGVHALGSNALADAVQSLKSTEVSELYRIRGGPKKLFDEEQEKPE